LTPLSFALELKGEGDPPQAGPLIVMLDPKEMERIQTRTYKEDGIPASDSKARGLHEWLRIRVPFLYNFYDFFCYPDAKEPLVNSEGVTIPPGMFHFGKPFFEYIKLYPFLGIDGGTLHKNENIELMRKYKMYGIDWSEEAALIIHVHRHNCWLTLVHIEYLLKSKRGYDFIHPMGSPAPKKEKYLPMQDIPVCSELRKIQAIENIAEEYAKTSSFAQPFVMECIGEEDGFFILGTRRAFDKLPAFRTSTKLTPGEFYEFNVMHPGVSLWNMEQLKDFDPEIVCSVSPAKERVTHVGKPASFTLSSFKCWSLMMKNEFEQ
jgi:hypothetical protein